MARVVGGRQGLSLLENVTALGVLALLLTALFTLLPSAVLVVQRSGCRLQADALAQSILEQTRAGGFKSLVAGTSLEMVPVDAAGTRFKPHLEILDVDPAVTDRVREIRVTVSWEVRNVPSQVRQSLLVANVPDS